MQHHQEAPVSLRRVKKNRKMGIRMKERVRAREGRVRVGRGGGGGKKKFKYLRRQRSLGYLWCSDVMEVSIVCMLQQESTVQLA